MAPGQMANMALEHRVGFEAQSGLRRIHPGRSKLIDAILVELEVRLVCVKHTKGTIIHLTFGPQALNKQNMLGDNLFGFPEKPFCLFHHSLFHRESIIIDEIT